MRAIRLITANWLNDQVGGDQNAIKVIDADMAREAVEVWGIAVYAPEHDPVQFVGTERAAERLEEMKATVTDFGPSTGVTAEDIVDDTENDEPYPNIVQGDFGQPLHMIEADLAEMRLPDEDPPGLKSVPLEPPRAVDNKAAWVNWAVNGDHGQPPITEEEANGLAKLALQHRYSGRL